MNIVAGLSGLKAAADLTKTLRDALKSGTIKPDEIAGRIGEIYDYITDSKAALVDAKEESEALKAELRALKDTRDLADSLQHDGKVYWIARGEKWDGPFCSRCWDKDKTIVRLDHQRTRSEDPRLASFWCPVDHRSVDTLKRPNVIPEQPPLRGDRW
jgi:hypothetical protein